MTDFFGMPSSYVMRYPVTQEQMREVLSDWPMKGEVVEVVATYHAPSQQDVPMEIDEYGNSWSKSFECLTEPPKLPVSIRKLKEYMQSILAELGFEQSSLLDLEHELLSPSLGGCGESSSSGTGRDRLTWPRPDRR